MIGLLPPPKEARQGEDIRLGCSESRGLTIAPGQSTLPLTAIGVDVTLRRPYIPWSTKYSHRAQQSEPRCVGAVYGAGRCGTYEGGCAANTCVRIARVFSGCGWGSNIWSSSSAGLLVVALSARPTCGRHTFYANLSDVTHMNKHLVHYLDAGSPSPAAPCLSIRQRESA